MSLSISTSWNSSLHSSGLGIIKQIKSLGFDSVELNFSLPKTVIEEISGLVRKKIIKVTSVHNFCPAPAELPIEEALPDCFSMSSLHEDIRAKSVRYTKATIDTAKTLGARVVVLHTGRVEIEDYTKTLMSLYRNNLQASPEYHELKLEAKKERFQNILPYFEQTMKSLKDISEYAMSKGICLGIENRIYYREIPSLDELEIILHGFKNNNVYYWHDTGHAQVYENLGFGRHEDFLTRYKDRLLGVHIHDVAGVDDHLPAGKGSIDFNMLKPFVKKDTIKVIETHQPASADDIIASKSFLEGIFNE